MMVADRETNQLSYQYSPISPAVGREQVVGEEQQEEEVLLPLLETTNKSVEPIIVSTPHQQPQTQQPIKSEPAETKAMETKVYRRRWIMLAIFVLVFMTNAFQWIQFSIINNLITKWVFTFKDNRQQTSNQSIGF